jgi:asparagine synthase (glutamine-hydrolysing)
MASTLRHRGPDEGGEWCDAASGIALAHRRLSILDLSAAGRQPMISKSGRYVLSFNGEIYNFLELRRMLSSAGASFEGHSDTEVLLSSIDAWGLARALEKLNGMFAFALWDAQARVIHLARDRIGEKPLYYGWFDSRFLFGSELKALRAHPSFRGDVDRRSLALYVRHGYVPAPYTIYEGVAKLPPGTYLSVPLRDQSLRPTPVPYWRLPRPATDHSQGQPGQSQAERLDVLDELLRDAVRIRMSADVPLGAFLSGGIDSSLVVALMQEQSLSPVNTFSIGFAEDQYNEAPHAKVVAEYLGASHTELYVDSKQALDIIPALPRIYDEPFGDSSQIPTCLLAALTRRHVTVALSGDGGDEIFAGYRRYPVAEAIWRKRERIPHVLRAGMRRYLEMTAVPSQHDSRAWYSTVFRTRTRLRSRARYVAELLSVDHAQDLYTRLTTQWDASAIMRPPAVPYPTPATGDRWDLDPIPTMMLLDAAMYLPDDILVKVDRATMSASLEARAPFLDHRLIEYAWRQPLSETFDGRQGKTGLRQLLARRLPTELFDRPKMGFAVPVDSWLRGPLRDWAEMLLERNRIEEEGYFNADVVSARWHAHLSGTHNFRDSLWIILMFQSWLESTRASSSTVSEPCAHSGVC